MKVGKKSPVGRNKTSPPAKPISESSGQQMVCKFCARQQREEEKFQLDGGSTVNIMADKTVKKPYGENVLDDLDKTSVTLVMYKKSELNLWATNVSRC